MLGRLLALTLTVALIAPGARAQLGPDDMGLRMVADTSGTAGTLCQGFSCTAIPANVLRGEKAVLEVRGMFGGLFAVFLAAGANSCVQIPPVFNALVLDPPIPFAVGGVLTIPETIRACPGGIAMLPIQFPQLPVSYQLSLQAVAQTTTTPTLAFSAAITVTAQ